MKLRDKVGGEKEERVVGGIIGDLGLYIGEVEELGFEFGNREEVRIFIWWFLVWDCGGRIFWGISVKVEIVNLC